METKSRQRIFVGYDDGSKSVKYYNAEMRKFLTSRNIRFLALTDTKTTLEPMVLLPDALCEGEPGSSTLPTSDTSDDTSDNLKRKRDQHDEGEEQRHTRVKKRVDYHYPNNPFPDKEEDQLIYESDDYTYAIIADEIMSLIAKSRN